MQVLVANHERFRNFLRTRVGQPADAEEILQNALLKGVEKAESVRDPESVVAWFYRLLRNALVDHHRQRAARARALERHAQEAANETAHDEALERVVCACLGELLATLKPEYASLLRRIDLEGGKLEEVAGELRITVNNATVRLHRARKALRQRLEQSCGTCTTHGCMDCTCEETGRSARPL